MVEATVMRFQHLEKVAGHELHDDEEAVLHCEVLNEADHVSVLKRLQQLDLAL